ncbi:MAG: hypothetical protein ABSH12_06530 [Endomicrobiales bacterium]|jgi:hypothetical protein
MTQNDEDIIAEMQVAVEKEEFMRDFLAFLGYVTKTKVKLTPELEMIPRKHIVEINKLLVHPLKIEDKIGDKVFKFHENNLPRIRFIDMLLMASGVMDVRKNTLVKGHLYDEIIALDPLNKKRWLALSWWFEFDFQAWGPYGGEFGERLCTKRLEMIPFFEKWAETPGSFSFKDTFTSLMETLHLYWGAPNKSFERQGVELGLWYCVFMPLQMMHIIDIKYAPGGPLGLKDAQEFSLNRIGRTIMREIIKAGETIYRNEFVASMKRKLLH